MTGRARSATRAWRELLATLAGEPPDVVVDAVEQAVVDAQEGEPRDDIALLALALPAEEPAGRRAG